MAIIGYARVSTYQQHLDSQFQRLTESGAIKIFSDVISGKTFKRTGLEDLLAYARPGDSVCVVRLDRLGRSIKELLETVEELKRRQVDLISLEEKIDTTSAAGELTFHLFGAIAHFERRLIAERTKDGLMAAKIKGKKLGRPELDKDKLDSAIKLVNAGISPTQAAKQLNIGRSTLYRELRYGTI
jgi:DNA invertase Pin-like site-specific DNA recombinase